LNGDKNLQKSIRSADWIGISVISEIEFLAFKGISEQDIALFNQFKARISVFSLESSNQNQLDEIIKIRKQSNVRLPDSVVAASAILSNSTLLTNDSGFEKIKSLVFSKF
jgi:tRNA(fMet)-specific endonuclease VapC